MGTVYICCTVCIFAADSGSALHQHLARFKTGRSMGGTESSMGNACDCSPVEPGNDETILDVMPEWALSAVKTEGDGRDGTILDSVPDWIVWEDGRVVKTESAGGAALGGSAAAGGQEGKRHFNRTQQGLLKEVCPLHLRSEGGAWPTLVCACVLKHALIHAAHELACSAYAHRHCPPSPCVRPVP